LVELLYRPQDQRTALAIFGAGRWTVQHHVDLGQNRRLVPYSPENNLIKNEVVLLPSEPRIYGTEGMLVADIQSFIHQYVDLSPTFEGRGDVERLARDVQHATSGIAHPNHLITSPCYLEHQRPQRPHVHPA
jgi:hypothetical protein